MRKFVGLLVVVLLSVSLPGCTYFHKNSQFKTSASPPEPTPLPADTEATEAQSAENSPASATEADAQFAAAETQAPAETAEDSSQPGSAEGQPAPDEDTEPAPSTDAESQESQSAAPSEFEALPPESGESPATPPETTEASSSESADADASDLESDIAAAAEEQATKEAERQKRIADLESMFEDMQTEDEAEETVDFAPIPIAGVVKPSRPKEGDLSELIINLEDVPAIEAIKNLADLLAIDYILSPEVGAAGTITIRTFGKLHLEDIYYVFLAILEMNNLVAVDVGPYYKIVPSADSLSRPLQTIYGKKVDGAYSDDSVLTQIIPLRYISPDEIINTLRPIIDQDASIITHPGSNLLIITGLQSNIKRLLKIIELLDVDTAVLEIEIFQINYADAQDIVSVLERIFQAQKGISATTTQRQTARTRRQPQQQAQPAVGTSAAKEILFIPDTRSNSIIVFAQRKDIEFIREIIAMLDVDIYVSRKTYIYYVQNAQASDMANLLSSIYTERSNNQRTNQPTARRTTTQQQTSSGAIGGPSMEGEVHIVADERTNALIIVTSPVNYPYIVETIEKLDIMPLQVLIEVLIADVSLQQDMKFGIDWTLRSQGEVSLGGDTYYFDGTSGQDVGVTGDTASFYYNLYEASRFTAWLKAHAGDTRLEVLSNPHLLVANNMEAKIDIGSEVPIVTAETTYDSTATNQSYNRTIQYRTTGILLTVTPQINEARYVNLDVSQEVSEVAAWTTEGGVDSPVISQRKASTSVVVSDGQTLVIGGMIQRKNNPSKSGIPWLSKIPVIGWLFGVRSFKYEAKELLIFLTPHVIATPDEARSISEVLRGKVKIEEEFYKDVSVDWK